MSQAELVAKLDVFFNVLAYDESSHKQYFPSGYESIFGRFAASDFLGSSWNGLMLNNATDIDRIYLIVFPSQSVLDTIIAREVERGAPGALIFSPHMGDYQESTAGVSFITEAQLEDLREHCISYYHCHAPLECHPALSPSVALADALNVREPQRFAPFSGGMAGVYGKVAQVGFNDFARKVATITELALLRYSAVRHNGRQVQQVAVLGGIPGDVPYLREALSLGCDTFVTGEWWIFGAGDARNQQREQMHAFLAEPGADINLIGTSRYASEAVAMRTLMPTWFHDNVPGVEPVFVPQPDPWR